MQSDIYIMSTNELILKATQKLWYNVYIIHFISNIIAVIGSEVVGSFVIRYKSERFRQNNIVGLWYQDDEFWGSR